jgi:hypothetical protein
VSSFGKPDHVLCDETQRVINELIAAGKFTAKDIAYISSLERPVLNGSFKASPEQLTRLRRLCQTWDIDIKLTEIKSHRPIIGPVIVALKKMLFPILKILLKDFVKAQREFNAATIMLLAEICNNPETSANESTQSRPTK